MSFYKKNKIYSEPKSHIQYMHIAYIVYKDVRVVFFFLIILYLLIHHISTVKQFLIKREHNKKNK